jgi:hypothetical protein
MRRLGVLLLVAACHGRSPQAYAVPGDRAPAVTVEVLNASGRVGNARVGARVLRDAGIDVVYFGNADATESGLDSTRVILRRGDRRAAEQVRKALGIGRISVEPDAGKLLDVSVLLGADFPPRTRPLDFHP